MSEETVFTFSPMFRAIPFVAAVCLLLVAIVFKRYGDHFKYCVFVGAALLAVFVFGPAMMMDRVVVNDSEIMQRPGFSWQITKGFRFEDVAYVHVTEKRRGAKRRLVMIWEIHKPDGSSYDLDPGDVWVVNSAEIIALLKQKGVEFR